MTIKNIFGFEVSEFIDKFVNMIEIAEQNSFSFVGSMFGRPNQVRFSKCKVNINVMIVLKCGLT